VVVGNIGSETRTKYGIIGAPVNLTNRLQSLAEGGQIVVSESVRTILKDQLDVAYSFETEVKGIASAVKVHALSPSATCAEVEGGLVMIHGSGR
jgi:class 3 adenylate cyclase